MLAELESAKVFAADLQAASCWRKECLYGVAQRDWLRDVRNAFRPVRVLWLNHSAGNDVSGSKQVCCNHEETNLE
jgi:hypothetical protein